MAPQQPAPKSKNKRKGVERFEIMRKTYVAAVETFLKNADWLTDEHEPAVTALYKVAEELDARFMASSLTQYGLMYRYLMNERPQAGKDEEADPLLTDFE